MPKGFRLCSVFQSCCYRPGIHISHGHRRNATQQNPTQCNILRHAADADKTNPLCVIVLIVLAWLLVPSTSIDAETVELAATNYRVRIDTDGCRFSFVHPDGSPWINSHP